MAHADLAWCRTGVAFPLKGETMSELNLQAELERLRAENAALKGGRGSSISMKVSEKGALSLYGLGRFPVTLYKEQWVKVLGMADDIRRFIAANNGSLKAKGEAGSSTAAPQSPADGEGTVFRTVNGVRIPLAQARVN